MAGQGDYYDQDIEIREAGDSSSDADQNQARPPREAQQRSINTNPLLRGKPMQKNIQLRHPVTETRSLCYDADKRDELINTLGAEVLKLRKVIHQKEAEYANASRGHTGGHGHRAGKSHMPAQPEETKRQRSLTDVERLIQEFVPSRSGGASSHSRCRAAISSKRQKTVTHVSESYKVQPPPRKTGADLRSFITQRRVERNRARPDVAGGNIALNRLVLSPFSPEIESLEPPKGFALPRFTSYNGKGDPYTHISHYRQMMTLYSRNDALMCKIFPSSLGEAGLRWFDKLQAGSITSWMQFSTAFISRFITHSRVPKGVDALLALKKGNREPLRSFAGRYFDVFNEIEGCNEELAVASFKLALPLGHLLRNSLTKRAATSVRELMERVEKHALIEEDGNRVGEVAVVPSPKASYPQDYAKVRSQGGTRYGGPPGQPPRERPNPREAINTIFNEPIYRILPKIRDEPYFAWPPKLPGDPARRNSKFKCSYHRDFGHLTENCRALKQHLEELVSKGHLRDFIEGGVPAATAQPDQRRQEAERQGPPRGVID